MVEIDPLTVSQGELCYTAEYRIQSECWTEEFVKSEVEIRSEIADPAVRLCRLCGSLRDEWETCFTSTGELAIDPQRLIILRLLCSVMITFEADPDAVICGFCCHKLDEMVSLRSIWLSNSTMIEQQRITVAAIENVRPMVWFPENAIKQESPMKDVATEAPLSSENCSVAVQTYTPVIGQADSPVIEIINQSEDSETCLDSAVQTDPPPVFPPEEPSNSHIDGREITNLPSDDGISTIDLTSNDDIPIVDLTCGEVSSQDSPVDEEKDILIRKAILLVQNKFKVKRLKEPKRRKSARLRNMTC
uniref:ZAD domain-containing protein n=1 Tax=Anopheles darlingi TaxID=43151 RepID=A0A2M4CJM2_ANODA